MATRSTIALEFADGTVQQVYCHWDGYLSHNGQILQEHYSDPFKLRSLVDCGDLSSLGPNIGDKHDFDCPDHIKYGTPEYEAWSEAKQEICTFYGRDRGEGGTNAKQFKDFEDYKQNHQYEEYEYILRRDGSWYVSQYGRPYELLSEALVRQEEEA
jgi:hypothetical protein